MLLADGPPLDPSSDTAHDWVAAELRRPEYNDVPSIWARLVGWLRDHLRSSGDGSGFIGAPSWLLVVLVLLVLAVIGYAVLRTVRGERRTAGSVVPGGVLGGTPRTATQYRAEASDALGAADWDAAVLAGFRAVAAGVVERSVLEESVGRTADEVARDVAQFFPQQADDLQTAARAFDAVRYGRLPAAEATARQVVSTEGQVAAARPVFTAPTVGAGR